VHKLLACAASIFLLTGPSADAAGLNVRKLTRLAARSSGLQVHARPKVAILGATAMQQQAVRILDREYSADQQAYDETLYRALGLLPADQQLRPWLVRQAQASTGLYDPLARTVAARSGSTLRHSLFRGLVTALEDQAFGLRKLSGTRPGRRDAALAATAAVDGYAAFADGARARTFAPVARTTPPLSAFLAVENRFAATTGVRFTGILQALGGRRAMFTALRNFPATTEQLLHIDAFLAREPAVPVALPSVAGRFGLERQDSFGELDVRALLTAFGVPDVERVATGWGGGRTGIYRDSSGRQAVVLALAWDDGTDADEWAAAVPAYRAAAFGSADAAGFARRGVRTALVLGPTAADAASLAAAVVSSP